MKQHISYSEIKDWKFCPYYRYLLHELKLPREDNIFLRFGKVIHAVCEAIAKKEVATIEEQLQYYDKTFEEELRGLEIEQKDLEEFREQGRKIVPAVQQELEKSFGKNYQFVAAEYELMEPISSFLPDPNFKFKGFVDLILYTPDDDTYHIVDWKTCTWGWDSRKKNDAIMHYQLVLYKCFYAEKNKISLDKIKLHFILLKRTAKNSESAAELVSITSKEKKMSNAKGLLNEALYNIYNGKHIKYRTRCSKCKFNNTEHCKK